MLFLVGLWIERPDTPYVILAYHLLSIIPLWAGAWLLAQRSTLQEELARRGLNWDDQGQVTASPTWGAPTG